LDGGMEVKVQASGYIFTEYLALEALRKDKAEFGETQQFEYGYRIHDVVASSMHDHSINFKADFDIAGTANTLYRVDVAPMTRKYPWDDEPRNTMHLVHNPITTESALDWPKNSGAVYVLLNNESTNSWGEKRGYRIVPGTGVGTPPHLTFINSTALGKAAGWAYHDLHIVQQHDTELRSASEWNAMEREDPLINFDKMLDGESTVQEDLVVYFNLGVHHVSNSADIPNTLMHWSGTSVMFLPHNYHDRDVSRESAQGVQLRMKGFGKGSKVQYYGGKYEDKALVSKVRLAV
jgi:primary-amine oxidase